MKNATRNYQEKCVMARILREGTRHQQNFSLRDFGSWEDAELAAGVWITQKLKELPPMQTSKGRMTKKNTSGVVGVQLDVSKRRMQNGNEWLYPRWIARWPDCPHKGGLAFKIPYNNFGLAEFHQNEKQAFVMAVLALRSEDISRTRIQERYEEVKGTSEEAKILSLRNEQGIKDRFWEKGIKDY